MLSSLSLAQSARRVPDSAWGVLPAFLCLTLGVWKLGQRQLWEDEYATWYAATLPQADFARLTGHMDLAVTPYYYLMRAWIPVFGDSPASLRLPSLLAMAVTAGLLVPLGRRLFGSGGLGSGGLGVGLGAGLLFAALPAVSRYAQEARPYAFAILFAVLSTLLLLRAIERPNWPRWMVYALSVLALGFSHLAAVLVLAAHVVLIRHEVRATDVLRLWRWLGALVLVICVLGPFSLYAAQQSQAISWIRVDVPTVLAVPERIFGTVPIALIVLALAVAGAIALWRRGERRAPLLLGVWAVFPPLFTLITFPVLNLFLYRYLLFTVPAWVLLAAAGAYVVPQQWLAKQGRSSMLAFAAVVAVAMVVGVPGQGVVRRDPRDGYPDFHALAAALGPDLRAGDGIAFAGGQFLARRALAYELRGLPPPRDVFVELTSAQRGYYTAQECAKPDICIADTTRLWLVTTANDGNLFSGMPPAAAALLQARFAVTHIRTFSRVSLVLLTAEGDQTSRP